MKVVKLISTKVYPSTVPEGVNLIYRQEYMRLCEMSNEGLTVAQMAVPIAIAAKLRAMGDDEPNLFLEDAEHTWLAAALAGFRFHFIAPEIVAMVAAVSQAETVTIQDAAIMAAKSAATAAA